MSKKYISDYLQWNAQNLADKTAVVAEDGQASWSELWQQVDSSSRALVAMLGSSEQKKVALLMPNSLECVIAYLAIIHAGHIVLPIDVIYKPLEIEAILAQIPTDLILTDDLNKARISSRRQAYSFSEIPKSHGGYQEPYRTDPAKMVATIFFTSGTTGKPKAAPNTHTNHLWNIKACSEVWQWTSDDVMLISLRLSHMHGSVMGLSGALYHGNTFVLRDRFDPAETLKLLSQGEITLFSHAPLAYSKMLEVTGDFDLSGVRLLISGSGPLSPATWQDFKDRFGMEILEVYGSSETGRIASNLLYERIAGSPGRPLPGVSLKFSQHNEVLVKSPGLFPGYYQNEALTKKHLTSEGYWRTGDIGELVGGRLILKGRSHEIIRRQGYTVSPRDIEWALLTNPEITEVSVVGVQQQEQTNDFLSYFVVTDLDEQAIVDFCKQSLPSVWRPDKIIKLDKLPRTSNGKISISKLKAMLN